MSDNNSLAFIHDGCTCNGYLEAAPGLYPAARLSYRPILLQGRAVIYDMIAKASPAKGEDIAAHAIAEQVISWDIRDHQGKEVEITVDNALRLQPMLSARIFKMITGDLGGDHDPEASTGENVSTDDEIKAALQGVSVQELQEKN